MFSFFELPVYVNEISERCARLDLFVHSFKSNAINEIYNPANFLHNTYAENVFYTLILDTNIYQFLVNSYKKENINSKHRDAIALLIFCQLSNIEVDPTYPVYEKLKRNFSNLDEVLNDLEIFHRINNADTNKLAQFALGISDEYELHPSIEFNRGKVEKGLKKFERIRSWHHYYLIILVISDIHINQNKNNLDKLRDFLGWMYKDYLKSAIGVVYAAVFWGKFPISKMMKLKRPQPKGKRQKAIDNMTWDLVLMDKFLSVWIGNKTQNEFMVATDDNAFKEVLRATVEIQKARNFEPLKRIIGEKTYNILLDYDSWDVDSAHRERHSESCSAEYIESLIRKYEIKLSLHDI